MPTQTSKLTIRLPDEDIAFVKRYAKANGVSVTEVIDRYLRRMRALDKQTPQPVLDTITGLVPSEVDVKAETRKHQQTKHSK